ncbi:MAG: zinc-dependent peptidase, partial [Candidatus Competibacteraceae bacterium]|nr:zinc-dependent peptidase [Candidatus Competibacteraceae bacterium]
MLSLKNWRRRRVLKCHRLDRELWQWLEGELPLLGGLSADERHRLQQLTVLFVHEKAFEAVDGLELDQAMQLAIAVQACLPVLNLGLDWYREWSAVVVYPGGFTARHEYADEAGVVHTISRDLSGEAWERGPLILSWEDVAASPPLDGYNVIIHECAHKLDMLNGEVNGFPPLERQQAVRWPGVWKRAYEDFCIRVERQEPTWLDPYGAE